MPERIKWDKTGERKYETGVDHGVFYPFSQTKGYTPGTPWNGLTNVTENPSGGEETPLYADNIKYASLYSAEEYGVKIEAYTYPDEFAECDGSAAFVEGVRIRQQKRKSFGLCYRTLNGNDTPDDDDDGYTLHLVYGCMATPSERSHDTQNSSPDAVKMSWDVKTVPVSVEGFKPTSVMEIDSRTIGAEKLKKLEDVLYGSETADAKLPTPDEVKALLAG